MFTNNLTGFNSWAPFSTSFEEIKLTEAGTSWSFWGLLDADTIISSKLSPGSIDTEIVWSEEVTSIDWDEKPTLVISILNGMSWSVVRAKFPSKSAVVPSLVPTITTLAPGIASPVSESVTVPRMVDCAIIRLTQNSKKTESVKDNLLYFIIVCFYYYWYQSKKLVSIHVLKFG